MGILKIKESGGDIRHRSLSGTYRVFLPAIRHTSQDHPLRIRAVHSIAMALPLADKPRPAVFCTGRPFRIVRQLPRTDGFLRARAYMVHSIFHQPLLQESGAGPQANRQGQGISRYGNILRNSPSLRGILPDSTSCSARSSDHRSQHIRDTYLHYACQRYASEEQPVRSRSDPFRILRLHSGLEQIR